MRVVLIGYQISYSASPAMQAAGFRAAGLEGWSYELLDVTPERLPEALGSLRSGEFAGANVTIPHKVKVLRMLDRLDPEAEAAGAVNTICCIEGRLLGSNTDVEGIRSALGVVGVEPLGAEVVVLGAGGSARAAAIALKGARLTFVARTTERAGGLPGKVVDWDDPGWPALVRGCDLLVNATPVGRREEMPFRPASLPRSGAIIDLVYVAGGTPLVRRARAVGLRAADGWDVLLAQGAAAFQLWTGKPAPLEAMRRALPA